MRSSTETARKIDELLDKEEIRGVLARYCRGVDRCDEELIDSAFHPGATDTHWGSDADGRTMSVTEPGKWFIKLVSRYDRSFHSITNQTIELDGDVAYCETYYHAHIFTDRGDTTVWQHSDGRYIDRFERRNGQWKIATRVLVPEASVQEVIPVRSVKSASARSHEDPSYQRRD